ncbi:hypothetical protein SAMN05444380_101207 [Thermophagus xiamenensis]|uniref:Uncharacterized protein n=1 Tax=Thermophagus xiamenensis TaxID=385682 RepID=A0A1I1UUH2_9BACT|nr:hypothetical protein SAMN05444380_101207 [Thermophagus xiamenensis]
MVCNNRWPDYKFCSFDDEVLFLTLGFLMKLMGKEDTKAEVHRQKAEEVNSH